MRISKPPWNFAGASARAGGRTGEHCHHFPRFMTPLAGHKPLTPGERGRTSQLLALQKEDCGVLATRPPASRQPEEGRDEFHAKQDFASADGYGHNPRYVPVWRARCSRPTSIMKAFQSRERDRGGVGGVGRASRFGGNGLLRAVVVALARGHRRQRGCGRAGGRRQERASPASHRDERRRTETSGVAPRRAASVLATRRGAGRTRRPCRAGVADRRRVGARHRWPPTAAGRGRVRCALTCRHPI